MFFAGSGEGENIRWVKVLKVLRNDSCKATVISEALLLFKKFPKQGLGQSSKVLTLPPPVFETADENIHNILNRLALVGGQNG